MHKTTANSIASPPEPFVQSCAQAGYELKHKIMVRVAEYIWQEYAVPKYLATNNGNGEAGETCQH
jgi:hypothetical protein